MPTHLQYGNIELSAVVIPEYRIRWQGFGKPRHAVGFDDIERHPLVKALEDICESNGGILVDFRLDKTHPIIQLAHERFFENPEQQSIDLEAADLIARGHNYVSIEQSWLLPDCLVKTETDSGNFIDPEVTPWCKTKVNYPIHDRASKNEPQVVAELVDFYQNSGFFEAVGASVLKGHNPGYYETEPQMRTRWKNPSYLTRIVGDHNKRVEISKFKIKNLPAIKNTSE